MHEAIESFIRWSSKEREASAEVVSAIVKIVDEKLYLGEGYSSPFSFLTGKGCYSSSAAWRRLSAAKVIKLRPNVLAHLSAGRLTLCSLAEASKAICEDNADEIINALLGVSKREAEKIVAQYQPPQPKPRESVKPIKVTPVAVKPVEELPLFSTVKRSEAIPPQPTPPPEPQLAYKYTFSADQEFQDLMAQVKVYTGNAPTPDILKQALKSLLRERSPKSQRTRDYNESARYIPNRIRQSVLQRDGHRCSFVSATGHRCEERCGLQIDHIQPFAKGGKTELSNLRVLCRSHNQFEAIKHFGEEKVYCHQRE